MKTKDYLIIGLVLVLIGLLVFRGNKWVGKYLDQNDRIEFQMTQAKLAEKWRADEVERSMQFEDSANAIISSYKDTVNAERAIRVKNDTKYQIKKSARLKASDKQLISDVNKVIKNDTGKVLIELRKEGVIEVLNLYDNMQHLMSNNQSLVRENNNLLSIIDEKDKIIEDKNKTLSEGNLRFKEITKNHKESLTLNKEQNKEIAKLTGKNKKKGNIILGLSAIVIVETLIIVLK